MLFVLHILSYFVLQTLNKIRAKHGDTFSTPKLLPVNFKLILLFHLCVCVLFVSGISLQPRWSHSLENFYSLLLKKRHRSGDNLNGDDVSEDQRMHMQSEVLVEKSMANQNSIENLVLQQDMTEEERNHRIRLQDIMVTRTKTKPGNSKSFDSNSVKYKKTTNG